MFLIRHAPTASNIGKVFMGQTDVPALAVEDPARLRVARAGPHAIYTSPLSRARTTASLLSPAEEAIVDARLSERCVGEWEGLDHATVKARWPDAFAGKVVDPRTTPPGGEAIEQFGERVASFLEMLTERRTPEDVYVVTHNGWVRMALLINGYITVERLFAESVPFLQPLALDLRPERLRDPLPIRSRR